MPRRRTGVSGSGSRSPRSSSTSMATSKRRVERGIEADRRRGRGRGRVGQVRIGVGPERALERLRAKRDHDVLDAVEHVQVGVRASELVLEPDPRLLRLGPDQRALAGAETEQHQLVVLAALELERATVGAIRHDGLMDVLERDRAVEEGRVGPRQVGDEPPEKALEIGHAGLGEGQSVSQVRGRPEQCQGSSRMVAHPTATHSPQRHRGHRGRTDTPTIAFRLCPLCLCGAWAGGGWGTECQARSARGPSPRRHEGHEAHPTAPLLFVGAGLGFVLLRALRAFVVKEPLPAPRTATRDGPPAGTAPPRRGAARARRMPRRDRIRETLPSPAWPRATRRIPKRRSRRS